MKDKIFDTVQYFLSVCMLIMVLISLIPFTLKEFYAYLLFFAFLQLSISILRKNIIPLFIESIIFILIVIIVIPILILSFQYIAITLSMLVYVFKIILIPLIFLDIITYKSLTYKSIRIIRYKNSSSHADFKKSSTKSNNNKKNNVVDIDFHEKNN